ncbi:MAG: tetratricopeptide repeat protein [Candidatus Omnitrophica bacterium]|nr:tetratricopeptide repeat protein [Candidatus Omnitrophota bacterium]
MKRAALFMIIVLACGPFMQTYALDWKGLHEKADKLTLAEAIKATGSVDGRYALGLVYLDFHKDKEAQDIFSGLLKADPGYIGARWGLAEVLRRRHKLDEAQRLCQELISENPDFVPSYITLAYIKYFRMDFKDCVRLATKVISMGSEKVDSSNLARAYSMLGGANGMIAHYSGPISKLINGSQVMSNLKRAQEIKPDSPAVLFGFGSYYLLAPSIIGGNLDKALVYLERAKDKDPLFADVYVRLAQAYKLKGDAVKYKQFLSKALEIDPGNELASDALSGECKYACSP